MCHDSEIQRTTSIVRVLAIAVILIAIFYAINGAVKAPNTANVAVGAARAATPAVVNTYDAATPVVVISKPGSGRGCGCGGDSSDFYDHSQHGHHHGHHYPVPLPPVPMPPPSSNYAIRLVHAAPDVRTPLTVTIDGQKVADNIVYGSVTKYINVPRDTLTVGLLSNGVQVATVPLTLPVDPSVAGTQFFTVAAVPSMSPLRGVPPIAVKTLADPSIDVAEASNAGIRFYHLSPSAPGVDIYANNKKVFTNVVYGTEVYSQVPAGDYSVDVVPTGKPLTASNIVYKNDNVVVAPNTILSIIAQGTKQLNVITAVSSK